MMLYPLANEPLTPAIFQNPGSEYRAAPFWAWNNKLDKEELCWQIEQLKQLGFGGFHMHVRTGMATEYLSDEYMEIVKACVKKAEQENMLAWLYDEDRWPSGAAGGIVTKNPQYREKFLLFTRDPVENGTLLACFDVVLNKDGSLRHYEKADASGAAKGFLLYAYVQTAPDNPWFNNQAYLDTLDEDAVRAFIETTYERYNQTVSDKFGSVIPAIFTDEPQFSCKLTLSYAADTAPVTMPWSTNLAKTFARAYGQDLVCGLPELLWDLPNGEPSLIRYRYHDHVAESFANAFAGQCGAWCRAHGIMLTGHMMQEPTLESQTGSLGDTMRSYRAFHLPGIDMLCDRREFTTAKQAQSAARQFGRPGVLSELYGVTNWDFDFRGHKLQGDWQAALGVTVRVPHLSWVSMNGEAKRDYPATFNYQAPWYKEYPYVEDHFARVNTAMTRGKAVCHVGVLHPVESYWLHWGAKENTQAIREEMDTRFQQLTEWLLRGQIDFDFISESLLPSQCEQEAITGAAFPVGEMRYEVLLVPPVETIRATTLERLRRFRALGGRIVFLGWAPSYVDALADPQAEALWGQCEHGSFGRVAVLEALRGVRELELRDESGALTQKLLYQLREEKDCRWLFICQADLPVNKDMPKGDIIQLKLRGRWSLSRYDTLTGEISPVDASCDEGWTITRFPFYEHDSALFRLEEGSTGSTGSSGSTAHAEAPALVDSAREGSCRLFGPIPVSLEEPNVLLLDIAEYALNTEEYRPAEEILRLDNVLRKELGWPKRGEAFAQPWIERDRTTPRLLRLRYIFASEIALQGAELALENAESCTVKLNGKKATAPNGWYVDKCIGKVALPDIIVGDNVLELELPYGRTIDLEACYLLGDFGVALQGVHGSLAAPVRQLAFGDITRQGLPFYGGNLTYHLNLELEKGRYELAATCYRGHLLRVRVDGRDCGVIAYSPYRLPLGSLDSGKHSVEVTLFGSRINTFGQLHQNDKGTEWWGPEAWRAVGSGWSYEYQPWPQGVLKAVEIFRA